LPANRILAGRASTFCKRGCWNSHQNKNQNSQGSIFTELHALYLTKGPKARIEEHMDAR